MSLSVYRFVSEERWSKSRGLLIMSSFCLQNVKISVEIEDLLKECAIWYTVHGINEITHAYPWAGIERQGYLWRETDNQYTSQRTVYKVSWSLSLQVKAAGV
jgi:hypothetical protein